MNGFAFDDMRAIVYNFDIRSWDNFFNIIFTTRGVRMVTYLLDYSLFGDSPTGYHLHSLLWQIAAVLIAYRLLQKLVKDEGAAIISAFIFAVHPLHVEAVANVSNRKEMICFVFFLSSLLSYISIYSTVSHRKKIISGGLSALFFLLAFRSKEIAIAIPAVFVLYELLYVEKDKRIIFHPKFAYYKIALFIIVLALSLSKFAGYILLDRNSYYFHYRLSGELMEYTHILYNSSIVFVYYIRNFLFPLNLLPDYFIPARGSLLNLSFALSFCFIVSYLYIIYISYRKNRAICFGLSWFLLNYLPISPFNIHVYPLCDRYIYLPSFGAAMVSGIVLDRWLAVSANKEKPLIGQTLLAIAFMCLAILSINYNTYWKNNFVLWEHALKGNPDSRIGRLNMSGEYGKMGRLDEAKNQIIKMGELDPRDLNGKQANMNLSEIYYRRQDKERAFELYRAIVAKVDHANPNITYPYILKFAYFFKESGLYKESLEAFNILKQARYRPDVVVSQVEKLNKMLENRNIGEIEMLKTAILSAPQDIRPRVNLGIIYYNILSYNKAEKLLREALKINSDSFEVRYNLGLVYMKKDDFEKAAIEFENAALLRRSTPPVLHDNLGLVYIKLGREEDALNQFLLAIRADKEFALSYLHLGNVYRLRNNNLKAINAYRAFLKYWDGDQYNFKLVDSQLSDLLKKFN